MTHAPTHYARLVQDTIERVVSRPSVTVTVTDHAASTGLTPLQLAWLFHGMVGEPIDAFVNRICLERAVSLLVMTDRPLTLVAEDVGYPSLDAFEVAFKAAFTTSPRLFRRLRTPRFELPADCGIHYREDVEPPLFMPADTNGRFLAVRALDLPALRLVLSPALPSRSRAGEQIQVLRNAQGRHEAPASSTALPGGFVVPRLDDIGRVTLHAAITIEDVDVLPPSAEAVIVPPGFMACCRVAQDEDVEQTWRRFIGEWLPSSAERLRPAPLLEALFAAPADGVAPGAHARTELYLPVV